MVRMQGKIACTSVDGVSMPVPRPQISLLICLYPTSLHLCHPLCDRPRGCFATRRTASYLSCWADSQSSLDVRLTASSRWPSSLSFTAWRKCSSPTSILSITYFVHFTACIENISNPHTSPNHLHPLSIANTQGFPRRSVPFIHYVLDSFCQDMHRPDHHSTHSCNLPLSASSEVRKSNDSFTSLASSNAILPQYQYRRSCI